MLCHKINKLVITIILDFDYFLNKSDNINKNLHEENMKRLIFNI